MARTPFIAGNWKMHKTSREAGELASALVKELGDATPRLMVAPPFTALPAVAEVLAQSPIKLGAQNMATEESGAHTGEVSVLMLSDLGVEVVIIGHSERRHVYGETDEMVNAKVRLALSHGLEVILCVGETLEEREAGNAEAVVERHLVGGLNAVRAADLSRVTIAYEPVWAIGTGHTATPEDADAMHQFIRDRISEMYSGRASRDIVIQYGGSVKPDNIAGLMAKPNVDGALVGGASLKAETFVPIARYDRA
ncbi:MAG: triose-phosphate isomerase [Spirochaetaceae bacterium]